jgi:DNA-binding CsgD family transcriptional regulator
MRRATTMFEYMSPASIAPIVDDPEICAVARDEHLKLVWCNAAYAANMGSTPERLAGTTLLDTMTPEQAKERMDMMRPVMHAGRMHAHQQIWVGKRWLTRVWPLDPEYFGHPGYFVLITRITDASSVNDRQVDFARSSDLGPLSVLSKRELEVFYYLATGMTAGDVARTLFRSEKTIGRHVENIHKKMGYTNRAQLVRDAVEAGLVTFSSEQWQHVIDPGRAQD